MKITITRPASIQPTIGGRLQAGDVLDVKGPGKPLADTRGWTAFVGSNGARFWIPSDAYRVVR